VTDGDPPPYAWLRMRHLEAAFGAHLIFVCLALCACARSKPSGLPPRAARDAPTKATDAGGATAARHAIGIITAKRLTVDPARARMPRAKAIVMGERWGCARFVTDAGSQWQCWDAVTTSSSQGPPKAWTVPWLAQLDGASVMSTVDHLCAYTLQRSYRCWERPRIGEAVGRELPARMEWANPAYAASGVPNAYKLRDFPRGAFTGGTFGCLLGVLGDLWCVGDDELGQLGDAGHRWVDQGLPTFFIRPSSWDVALGPWHGCALPGRSSQAVCWGRGDAGQLGGIPATSCRYRDRDVACARTAQAGPVTSATERERAIRAGDLFTCAADPNGILCWGANQDAFFGARQSCPAGLRRSWPTLQGTTSAPNAACPAHPERVAGITEFPKRFEVGPRGLCFGVGGAIQCRGAIPTPRGSAAFHTTVIADSEEAASVMGAHTLTGPDVIAVSPGQDASACAIHADGSVVCWGEGYSPADAPDLPVAVSFETATPPSEVAAYGIGGSPDEWGDDDCVIRRGCTLRPATVPPCPSTRDGDFGFEDAPTWADLVGSAQQHEGQIVRVRGSLKIQQTSMSTQMICFAPGSAEKRACCEVSSGIIVLDGVPGPLALDGLFCGGDESETCCNAPAYGQTVVVTGRLTRSPSRWTSGWTIAEPTLCEPRD
jgi:hypothetical protein